MKPITFPILEQMEPVQHIKALVDRGSKEQNLLWALEELQPLLDLFHIPQDVQHMIDRCNNYSTNPISVRDARAMALTIHRYARETENQAQTFMYRALGHSIATIHVHTHAYGMTLYALKAYHQLGYTMKQLHEIAQQHKKRLEENF